MRFRAEFTGAARAIEADDRDTALDTLEPAERLSLRRLAPEDEAPSPAHALAALAQVLEGGLPLSGPRSVSLSPATEAALAQGEPLAAALAQDSSTPPLLVALLEGPSGDRPAVFVRLAAAWQHRIESARLRRVTELLYPLCVLAVGCAAAGVVLSSPTVGPALNAGARTPAFVLGLVVLFVGGAWLRRRWGKPGTAGHASHGFRLQTLALCVRQGLDLPRVWPSLFASATPPSEGDPCAAIAAAVQLGEAESACLRHSMGVSPAAFADDLLALGEVRLRWAEAQLARRAALLRVLVYAAAASLALAYGVLRMFTHHQGIQ